MQQIDEPARRTALPAWCLLALTDTTAVVTLSRCFSGPGELSVLVPTCLAVHLLAGGGRRLGHRLQHGGALAVAGWLLALVAGLMVPILAVDARSLSFGLPLGHTWDLASRQLNSAWVIFSSRLAPVAEAPGLVLGGAWACGAVALAAEVLYSDAGLPAVLALVPAFDLVVFTGTLGTTNGRSIEIVLVAGSGLAFLIEAQHDKDRLAAVLMARPLVASGEAPSERRLSRRWHSLPGVTIAAALVAGLLGPVLPGATSAPFIALHGARSGGRDRHGSGADLVPGQPSHVEVSSLVQVAEQEVEDQNTLLVTVHSRERTYEQLFSLDRFNGVSWSRSPGGRPRSLGGLPRSAATVEHHLPKARTTANGSEVVEQAIRIGALGGRSLPVPGVTEAVEGDGAVTTSGEDGPVVARTPLRSGLTYALRAELPPGEGSVREADSLAGRVPALAQDLQLPQPVPASLRALARSITSRYPDSYAKAVRLRDYFLEGHGFAYSLPTVGPSGAIANTSASYVALEAFLFHTKKGYCQQFATAFAVLARLAGLPTRIAVGFVPGKEISKDTYEVTGADVHAWPQVYLANLGWVTFDPTPGAGSVPSTPKRGGGAGPTTTLPPGVTTTTTAHHLGGSHFGRTPTTPTPKTVHPRSARKGRGDATKDLWFVLLGLVALWVVAVPSWRGASHLMSLRDPGRATERAWAAAVATLAVAGAHRRRAETHREYAERVRVLGLLGDDASDALFSLAARMDRLLYSGGGPSRAESRVAWAESAAVRRSARRNVPWWHQALLFVDPRDLLPVG